jgi:hypothetical protein
MTVDLTIRPIVSKNGEITLLVEGANLPDGGLQLPRTDPKIDEALLRHFQRAKLDAGQLGELSKAVTEWLYAQDLKPFLNGGAPANKGRLRVLVNVPDNARQIVSQVPFELLWDDAANTHLLLRQDVASLCYVLSKTRAEGAGAPVPQNWPFKILLVRSCPPDYDDVPEVSALAEYIRQAGVHYGPNMVQVDVISREAAVKQPATWTHLIQHLKERGNEYNVLVYLGHGEVMAGTVSAEPIGHIIFESEDGAGHQPVSAPQLARLLARHPINLVVLAGCVTGADPASNERRYGGEQGVAQALVNSAEAKVQVAVAMRSELITTAASMFLEAFFESLFDITPDVAGNLPAGNVEAAVQHARNRLYIANPVPPQWAAPIVLRSSLQEPFIEHLAQSIRFVITPNMQMLLEVRATFWKSLAQSLPDHRQGRLVALAEVRQMIVTEGLRQGPLILPREITVGPGQAGRVEFELAGPLTVRLLRGRISVPAGIAVKDVAVPAVTAAAFRLLLDQGDPGWFELRARDDAPARLPEGTLLEATLEVAADQPAGVYPVAIETTSVEPPTTLWPGDGVLIVPHP